MSFTVCTLSSLSLSRTSSFLLLHLPLGLCACQGALCTALLVSLGFPLFLSEDFLQIKVLSHSVVSDSFRPHGLQPARLLCPWDSPGNYTGVGGHALSPQGIFPTQGLNLDLLHCRQIVYHLHHQGRWAVLIFYCRASSLSGSTFHLNL